ncbi:hypothetical protein CHH26_12975 [Qipengyuania flava]|nr:hypothetical protein CHH26_12975 [Qipengyuania flava]
MWMQKRGLVGAPFFSGTDRRQADPLQQLPSQIAREQFATQTDRAIRLQPEYPCCLGFAADLTEARERRGFGVGQVEPPYSASAGQNITGQWSEEVTPKPCSRNEFEISVREWSLDELARRESGNGADQRHRFWVE